MAAEMALPHEIVGDAVGQKLLSGVWIISPRHDYHLRYCSFVMPTLYPDVDVLADAVGALAADRGWQTLATFLTANRIGIIVSGGMLAAGQSLDEIVWHNFVYLDETLHLRNGDEPFASWQQPGHGRASKGKDWEANVEARYLQATLSDLTEMLTRQAFLEGYLKGRLRKTFGETYDMDAFIVGFSGRVLPLEIKEKSRVEKTNQFGVDAGRILMLLRFCLMTDSNALYVIREVNNQPDRALIGWVYMTLADLVMMCRWNLQGGGAGMGGGATQTIMMSAEHFQPFSAQQFSEEWIQANGSLSRSVRLAGQNMIADLEAYLR